MAKKPTSKVNTVITLCKRKSGTTLDEISKKLHVSATAAASLIGDARRKGIKIKYDVESGRYYL